MAEGGAGTAKRGRRPQGGGRHGTTDWSVVSLVAVLALGGGLPGATPAWATPPKHLHLPLNISFHDDALSDACGFDVFEAVATNLDVTLLCDQSGTLIREIDTVPTGTFSFAAPSTGNSIVSRAPAVLITDYTGGVPWARLRLPASRACSSCLARRDARREAGVRCRGRGRRPRGDPHHHAHQLDLPERQLLLG